MTAVETAKSGTERSSIKAIHRHIVSASLRLAALTLVVKAVSAGKDVFVAQRFGAGYEMDAFIIAMAIPIYLINVLGTSISSALLPSYVEVRQQQGGEAGNRQFGSALSSAGVLLLVATLTAAASGSFIIPILAKDFDADQLLLAKHLLYVLLGVFIIGSSSMLLGVALNCDNRFAITGTAPLAIPAVTLIALWAGQGRWGIYALAAGTLAGYVIEFAVLVYGCLTRGLLRGAKFRANLRDLLWLARLASPLVISAAILGFSSIVDQALAATLAPGSVSALSYGNKLVSLFVTVAVTSLSTTAFPSFSRLVASSQWSAVRATLKTFIWLILALTIPLTIALALSNEWIVRTLFERGSFTAQTTAVVAPIQLGYLLQIPFYTVGVFGVRLLTSMGGNTTVLKIAVCSLTVNVIGDLVLMRYFGAAGIAASTSLVYFGASIMILAAVYRRLAFMERRASIPRPHFSATAAKQR